MRPRAKAHAAKSCKKKVPGHFRGDELDPTC